MNPWDIDPNLYLPLMRSIHRALRRSLQRLARRRRVHAASPPIGCRG